MNRLMNIDKPVVLIGAGGHAKVLLDTLKVAGIVVLGIVDKSTERLGQTILGIAIVGDEADLPYLPNEVLLVNGIGSIGNGALRRKIFEKFTTEGYQFATVIHPSAVIAQDVELAAGVQVMAGAVIQTGCKIGVNSIINTRVSLDHDCVVQAHVHISPGSVVCGCCLIGDGTHIGAGSTLIQGINVGERVLVGAGSLVLRNIDNDCKVYGIPAKEVKIDGLV